MEDQLSQVIHCIGDSHVSLFSGLDAIAPYWPHEAPSLISAFKLYHLGPVLAYNLIAEKSTTKSKAKLTEILRTVLPPSSWVLLCFGEIDCRAHLLKQAEKSGRSNEVIVRTCVDRYFKALQFVQEMGHKPIAYNAIPSARRNKPTTGFPTYGNCRQRNQITQIFNDYLELCCREAQIPFVDTFDSFVNKRGLTNRAYYMDRIHLSRRALPVTLVALKRVVPEFSLKKCQAELSSQNTSVWQRLARFF
jgi:lysophospholipase L1-like esterase